MTTNFSELQKILTVREYRSYTADEWDRFNAEIRKRLLKVNRATQRDLLKLSKRLARRKTWRGIFEGDERAEYFVDKYGGKL